MNNLEQPFAAGRTAEIFPYGNGKVLKLFFPSIPLDWINKETDIGRYIQDMPLPVPKVYERIKAKEREGLIYERIDGPSLLSELARKPWTVARTARLLAKLHVQVHQVAAPSNIEPQKEWATGGIPESKKLSPKLRDDVLQLLESLPQGDRLCHGDFHPGNIILTRRGPVIIDWMTTSRGTAAGDVARSSVIMEVAKPPEGTPLRWLLERIRSLLQSTYEKTYFKLNPVETKLFFAWRAVMAANFFDVSIPEEEPNLFKIIEQGLMAWKGG